MEETNNEPSEDLQSDEMENHLRDDIPALNTLGDDEQATQPSNIIGQGNESFSFKNQVYEISMSSSLLQASDLAEICYLFLQDIKENKTKNKSTGGYVG